MPTLRFEGHSDDTFGEYGHFDVDRDNCANGRPHVFKVEIPGRDFPLGFYVWGLYSPDKCPESSPACWVIGLQQLGEGIPFPDWPLRWEITERGYSPALIIDAPEGVTLNYAE